jgi:hypothetical protein
MEGVVWLKETMGWRIQQVQGSDLGSREHAPAPLNPISI